MAAATRSRGRLAERKPLTTKPRNDAYTGLLAISLGAMVVGCVLLYLDWTSYTDKKPPEPPKSQFTAPPGVAPAPPSGPGTPPSRPGPGAPGPAPAPGGAGGPGPALE